MSSNKLVKMLVELFESEMTSKSIIFRDKLDTFVFAQCVDNKAKEKQLRFRPLLE